MSVTTQDGAIYVDGRRALCGSPADDGGKCARDIFHDGPHRNTKRGEWLNLNEGAETCPARTSSERGAGRCRRDKGHDGGHADHKRGLYWQAAS